MPRFAVPALRVPITDFGLGLVTGKPPPVTCGTKAPPPPVICVLTGLILRSSVVPVPCLRTGLTDLPVKFGTSGEVGGAEVVPVYWLTRLTKRPDDSERGGGKKSRPYAPPLPVSIGESARVGDGDALRDGESKTYSVSRTH